MKDVHETQSTEQLHHDAKTFTPIEGLHKITDGAWNRKSLRLDSRQKELDGLDMIWLASFF